MMRYSVQHRNQIFVKDYRFLCFAKNKGKNIGKNKSKNVTGKYSKKLLDHAKQATTDAFETVSKGAIKETAEATGDFLRNKIANRITKILKSSQQNNSVTVTIGHGKEIPKEIYISPEERQKIIDDRSLI